MSRRLPCFNSAAEGVAILPTIRSLLHLPAIVSMGNFPGGLVSGVPLA